MNKQNNGRWIRTPPTTPGWYFAVTKGSNVDIVHVYYEKMYPNLVLNIADSVSNFSASVDFWWSEPIQFPEEPE